MATRVVDLGNVRGPQGLKGDAGPTGPQGPRGETGPRGPAGSAAASCLRPARFVVGTTAAGWTTADCDYLCDGTEDQEEINAAIAALPSAGGEVVLLDGTYYVRNGGPVLVNRDRVTLRGAGLATRLDCDRIQSTIEVTGSDCTIRDLCAYCKHDSPLYMGGTASRLTLMDTCMESGSSGDYVCLRGEGCVVVGNRFVDENGGLSLSGSGHVVMGNILSYNVYNNATNCAVSGNVVIPWEED